jgi:hypothetical protein
MRSATIARMPRNPSASPQAYPAEHSFLVRTGSRPDSLCAVAVRLRDDLEVVAARIFEIPMNNELPTMFFVSCLISSHLLAEDIGVFGLSRPVYQIRPTKTGE